MDVLQWFLIKYHMRYIMTTAAEKIRSLSLNSYAGLVCTKLKEVRDNKEFQVGVIPYTPLPVIDSIIEHTLSPVNQKVDLSIAVLYTVEIALRLCYLGFNNITLITKERDKKIQLYAEVYGFRYIVLDENEEQFNMPIFDITILNPSWTKGMYKAFVEDACEYTKPSGQIVVISQSSFLAGSASRKYRLKVAEKFGFKRIDILPRGVFKTLKKDGNGEATLMACVTYLEGGYKGPTHISRSIAGAEFSWDDQFNGTDKDILLFYDGIGKALWEQCQGHILFDLTQHTKAGVRVKGPNVNMPEKTHMDVFDKKRNILEDFSGGRILTGVVCDVDGSKPPTMTKNNKRFIFNVGTETEAINLYRWMMSKLFGILLTMTSTQHNVSGTTLGKIPYVVLSQVYETDEDFNQAIYEYFNLSIEFIQWIEEFGSSKCNQQ